MERGQYQFIYDSFVYQKMAEVCFVFFNNKIQSLYKIPDFYNEPITSNDIKKAERLTLKIVCLLALYATQQKGESQLVKTFTITYLW